MFVVESIYKGLHRYAVLRRCCFSDISKHFISCWISCLNFEILEYEKSILFYSENKFLVIYIFPYCCFIFHFYFPLPTPLFFRIIYDSDFLRPRPWRKDSAPASNNERKRYSLYRFQLPSVQQEWSKPRNSEHPGEGEQRPTG